MLKKAILTIAVLVLISTSFLVSPAYAQNIVIPPQFENQAGFPTESVFICTLIANGLRVQALYPGSDLGPGTIGGFSLRTVDGFPAVGAFTLPDNTIRLSTTDIQPGDLTNTFANNIGSDELTVYSGDLHFDPIPSCNTSPCPFNITVTFQTPFDYDPSEGNLLLDWTVPTCMDSMTPFIFIDSTLNFDELDAVFALSASAIEGSPALWNITQISYLEKARPIPALSELSFMVLAIFIGLTGLIVARRREEHS